MADWRRLPGIGRYALPERERRFVVAGEPTPDGPSWLIEDRYIRGTTLRLRRVTGDGESVYKLTQKVRPQPGDPSMVSLTNMYLISSEYELLTQLPADVLVKSRAVCTVDGVGYAVDTFEQQLAGLRLAEAQVDEVTESTRQPSWLGREVTHDDRFSGGRLAATSATELANLLESVR